MYDHSQPQDANGPNRRPAAGHNDISNFVDQTMSDLCPPLGGEAFMVQFDRFANGAHPPAAAIVIRPHVGLPIGVLGLDLGARTAKGKACGGEWLLLREIFGRHSTPTDRVRGGALCITATHDAVGLLIIRLTFDAVPTVALLLNSQCHNDVLTAMVEPHELALMSHRMLGKLAQMSPDAAAKQVHDTEMWWRWPVRDQKLAHMLSQAGGTPEQVDEVSTGGRISDRPVRARRDRRRTGRCRD